MRCRHDTGGFFLARQIGAHDMAFAAHIANIRRQFIGGIPRAVTMKNNIIALPGQIPRNYTPDPFGSPCDKGGFWQIVRHRFYPFPAI
jgi:hypothetical protein